jgi:hypothetical protein
MRTAAKKYDENEFLQEIDCIKIAPGKGESLLI